MNRFPHIIIFTVWLACGLCFLLVTSSLRSVYLGFAPITWIESVRCNVVTATAGQYPNVRYREVQGHGGRHFGYCRGAFDIEEADRAVLEYQVVQYAGNSKGAAGTPVVSSAVGSKAKVKIAVDDEKGRRIFTVAPLLTGDSWRRLKFSLPGKGRYTLHLVNKETLPIAVRVRDKVDRFKAAEKHEMIHAIFAGRIAKMTLQALFAGLSFLLLLGVREKSLVLRFLFFLSISFFYFYRLHIDFAIDEWDLLKRLYTGGVSSALVTHNEHFIPVFTLFYYLQYQVFAGAYFYYVLISLVLHCVTALLLQSFVSRLLAGGLYSEQVSYWASAIYLLSCLHAESIQWSICQSTLLFMMFGLLSLILAWDYFANGSRTLLFWASATLLLALFSFGAAFVLLLQIPMFVAYQYYRGRETIVHADAIHRGIRLMLSLVLIGGAAAILYWLKRDGFGIGVDDLRPNSFSDVLAFAGVGSQFGTVLRGSGLYPFEGFGQLASFGLFSFSPSSLAFLCGLLLSLLLLLFYRRMRLDEGHPLLLWVMGQACILMPIALVAIGRAGYGIHHSYVLRYQSPAVFGLCVLFLPLLQYILSKAEIVRRRWCHAVLPVFFLFAHLQFLRAHTLYTYNGSLQETFLEQLEYWNAVQQRAPLDEQPSYEGIGTRHEGLQPMFYWGYAGNTGAILPFVHPDTMLYILANKRPQPLEQMTQPE